MYKAGIPAAISQSSLTFKYQDLKKASGNFSVSNKLGQGSYGTVYKVYIKLNADFLCFLFLFLCFCVCVCV